MVADKIKRVHLWVTVDEYRAIVASLELAAKLAKAGESNQKDVMRILHEWADSGILKDTAGQEKDDVHRSAQKAGRAATPVGEEL